MNVKSAKLEFIDFSNTPPSTVKWPEDITIEEPRRYFKEFDEGPVYDPDGSRISVELLPSLKALLDEEIPTVTIVRSEPLTKWHEKYQSATIFEEDGTPITVKVIRGKYYHYDKETNTLGKEVKK